jgi:hypothetical protein
VECLYYDLSLIRREVFGVDGGDAPAGFGDDEPFEAGFFFEGNGDTGDGFVDVESSEIKLNIYGCLNGCGFAFDLGLSIENDDFWFSLVDDFGDIKRVSFFTTIFKVSAKILKHIAWFTSTSSGAGIVQCLGDLHLVVRSEKESAGDDTGKDNYGYREEPFFHVSVPDTRLFVRRCNCYQIASLLDIDGHLCFKFIESRKFEFVAKAVVETERDGVSVERVAGVIEEERFDGGVSSLDGGAGADAGGGDKRAEFGCGLASVDSVGEGAKLG